MDPSLAGHLRDVVDIGQGELGLLGRIRPSAFEPQPPKHTSDEQQNHQQTSEHKGFYWGRTCI